MRAIIPALVVVTALCFALQVQMDVAATDRTILERARRRSAAWESAATQPATQPHAADVEPDLR